VGCGDPNLGSVSGTVTLDGKPVPNAAVKFFPTGTTGAPSFGKTDSNGNFTMWFSESKSGAWIGQNRVQITTGDVGVAPGMGTKETIPIAYNEQSTLVETVKPGKNKIDLKLSSDASKVVQQIDLDSLPSRKK
jgi:hypothetical protein